LGKNLACPYLACNCLKLQHGSAVTGAGELVTTWSTRGACASPRGSSRRRTGSRQPLHAGNRTQFQRGCLEPVFRIGHWGNTCDLQGLALDFGSTDLRRLQIHNCCWG